MIRSSFCSPYFAYIGIMDTWILFRRAKLIMQPLPCLAFFCKGALFRGKGGSPVLEKPARHLPRQGQGFVRPPVCPTPPAISSSYGGASGGQLTDCWHQMSNYVQCILFLCCCIVSYVINEWISGCCINLFMSLTEQVMSGSGIWFFIISI